MYGPVRDVSTPLEHICDHFLSTAYLHLQASHYVVHTTSQPASREGIPCVIQCVHEAREHLFKAFKICSETWDSALVHWFGRLHIAVAVAVTVHVDVALTLALEIVQLWGLLDKDEVLRVKRVLGEVGREDELGGRIVGFELGRVKHLLNRMCGGGDAWGSGSCAGCAAFGLAVDHAAVGALGTGCSCDEIGLGRRCRLCVVRVIAVDVA